MATNNGSLFQPLDRAATEMDITYTSRARKNYDFKVLKAAIQNFVRTIPTWFISRLKIVSNVIENSIGRTL